MYMSRKLVARNGFPPLTFAPLDLDPLGPMLAMTPAFAIGDSDATYASAEEDCAYAPTARAAQETRKEKRILTDELHWKASDDRRLLTRLTTTTTERTEASADFSLNLSRIYTSSARRYYA